MKTKTILLTIIFLCLAVARGGAQIWPDDTRSTHCTFSYEYDETVDFGDHVAIIHFNVTYYETDLFKDGEVIRGINHVNAIAVDLSTGEEYRVNIHIRGYLPISAEGNFTVGNWLEHIAGSKGSVYMITGTFTTDQPDVITKVLVPGEKNNN